MNWLLLRGLAREQRHWGDFGHRLEAYDQGFNVHFIDLPGFGKESHAPSPLSVKETTEWVREKWQLEYLKNSEGPWCIMGMSLGGMVVLDWAHRYGEDFKGAIVVNSSARSHSPFWRRLHYKSIPRMVKILSSKCNHYREKETLKMVSNLHHTNEDVHKDWVNIAETRPKSRLNVFAQLAAASFFHAPEKIELPIMFLNSTADNMVDPSCTQKLAEHYEAPIEYNNKAGHDLTLDDPEWTIEQMADFANQFR